MLNLYEQEKPINPDICARLDDELVEIVVIPASCQPGRYPRKEIRRHALTWPSFRNQWRRQR